MSSKQSDVVGGASSFILGFALLTWLIPVWVEPDHDLRLPVSLVPQIVAVGFMLCGAALVVKAIFFDQSETTATADAVETEPWFRLLAMVALLIGATVGFQFLHFLLVAPALVAMTMWMYGPVQPIRLIVTSVLGPVAIWVFATQLLGRVVP